MTPLPYWVDVVWGRFGIVCIAVCRRPLRGRAGPSHARLGLGRFRSWIPGARPSLTRNIRAILRAALSRDDLSRSLNGGAREVVRAAGRAPKRIALFAALRGARRSVGALDVNKCVTQLHCEWTKQVATVCPIAGLTGLLQRGSRSAKAGGANRSCGPA